MTSAFKCNGCGSFMTEAALRIERTDGWAGGGGIRITAAEPWDLCRACAQAIDGALANLAQTAVEREAEA